MSQAHLPCPDCGSSDALLLNDDGSSYCFSCETYHPAQNNIQQTSLKPDFIKGVIKEIPDRCLTRAVCERFNYRVGTYSNRPIHIATYRDFEGNPIFQKIRFTDTKEFFIVGKLKSLLYGCHLCKGQTKKIIITEGEIDCLSVCQVVGNYPVVSIPNGVSGAAKAIKENLQWLEKFEEVVFCFDMDEVGRKAAKECASLLSFGKAKIMFLPLKDPNKMLQEHREKELYSATWQAEDYHPDNITDGTDKWEEINKPVEWGLSYPWEGLTQLTYGIRVPEMICFGAGTGMGKTELFKEIEAHFILQHKVPIGIIHLEENVTDTILGLMSKHSSILFHIPDTQYTPEEKRKAYDETIGTGRVIIYDGFGTTDFKTIKDNIRYMVKGKDCKFIFLDHITALADGVTNSGEVNQKMRNIISELASLTRELQFTLILISHLRKPEGKPHEEGGRVHLDDLYGAAALKQWCSYVFGLERNQQAKNLKKRNQTALRCLKDRYTGRATGKVLYINYQTSTGRLIEGEPIEDEEKGFNEEDEDF